MATNTAKVQNLSDLVYKILNDQGLSKLFNWEDYHFFKKQSEGKKDRALYIAEQFIFWNMHEQSDFADYDF